MTDARSVLLVEDAPRVAAFVARGLRAEGWTVIHEDQGRQGLARALAGGFAVGVFDVMLPDMTGFDLCQRLRAGGSALPVLLLTALDSVEDRVKGLRLGADDYLCKPFAFDELLARIEALARRGAPNGPEVSRLAFGDLALDRRSMIATRAGRALDLTARELALLDFLMVEAGRVVSRERILSRVWGASEDPLTNVVDVFVRRLRRKLDDDEGRLIRTVRGHGYRFEPEG